MITNIEEPIPKDADPFGLRKLDFINRIPERTEMFSNLEAQTYIDGCDYPKSVDDLLFAWEINKRFNHIGIERMHILDAMTGPGRLGSELLSLGASHITFHDGHNIMLDHAEKKALELFQPDRFSTILSPVDTLKVLDNTFDLVVCHNSTHQLENAEKLRKTLAEFMRVTKPNGWIVIADYQRNWTPKFINSLEDRLIWTRSDIIPLLLPTFQAAFTKEEFNDAVEATTGVQKWLVFDASLPTLSPEMLEKIEQDPVKGHVLDFSPISCRVCIQKETI